MTKSSRATHHKNFYCLQQVTLLEELRMWCKQSPLLEERSIVTRGTQLRISRKPALEDRPWYGENGQTCPYMLYRRGGIISVRKGDNAQDIPHRGYSCRFVPSAQAFSNYALNFPSQFLAWVSPTPSSSPKTEVLFRHLPSRPRSSCFSFSTSYPPNLYLLSTLQSFS